MLLALAYEAKFYLRQLGSSHVTPLPLACRRVSSTLYWWHRCMRCARLLWLVRQERHHRCAQQMWLLLSLIGAGSIDFHSSHGFRLVLWQLHRVLHPTWYYLLLTWNGLWRQKDHLVWTRDPRRIHISVKSAHCIKVSYNKSITCP